MTPEPVSAETKPSRPASLTKRWWTNIHAHVIFWLVFMGAAITVYVSSHILFNDRYHASNSVDRAVRNAVNLYQLQENPETNQIELTFEGAPLDLQPDATGSLGIAKLATARGLFANTQTKVDQYNRRVESYIGEIISGFRPVEAQQGYFYAPLSNFGDSFGAAPGQIVRIYEGEIRKLYGLPGNEKGVRQLLRLLASAQVYDTTIPVAAGAAPGMVDSIDKNQENGDVAENLRRIEKTTRKFTTELGFKKLESPTGQDIRHAACGYLDELREPLRQYFEGSRPEPIDEKRFIYDCGNSVFTDSTDQPNSFHSRLKDLVISEIGFFWVFGIWRWIEILMLTWLGVLTEGLTRLGVVYAGRDPDNAVWEPRESGRTALKLVYAPALSIVVIFSFMLTDLFETETAISDGGITWFIPVAFLLGLFPNLGYSLLERLAKWIFQKTSVAAPRRRPRRVTRREVGTAPVPAGEPPDFRETIERTKKAAIAPLRERN